MRSSSIFYKKKRKDNMAALWKSLCYFVSTEIPAAWYRSNINRSFPSNAKALMVLVFCCFYLGGRKKKSKALCRSMCSCIPLASYSHCVSVRRCSALSLLAPFSPFPLAPPAPPLRPVELWACPKWMPPACRMSTSSLLSLVSTAPGQTLMML